MRLKKLLGALTASAMLITGSILPSSLSIGNAVSVSAAVKANSDTKLKLDSTSIDFDINYDGAFDLTGKITGDTGSEYYVYAIDDKDIVTADTVTVKNGAFTLKVTPQKTGQSVLRVNVKDKNAGTVAASANVDVKVGKYDYSNVKLSVSKTSLSIDEGKSATIRVQADNTPKGCYWSCDLGNEGLLSQKWNSVTVNGKTKYRDLTLTGLKAGKQTVKVRLQGYSGKKTIKEVSVSVTVQSQVSKIDFSLSQTNISVEEGESVTVRAKAENFPSSVTPYWYYEVGSESGISAKWGDPQSSNTTIYDDLTISGVKAGKTSVKVKLMDKNTKEVLREGTVNVTVLKKYTVDDIKFSLSKTSLSITEGEAVNIRALAEHYPRTMGAYWNFVNGNKNYVSASWGDAQKNDSTRYDDLSITGLRPGTTTVKVQLKESASGSVLREGTINIKVVKSSISLSLSSNNVSLRSGEAESVQVKLDNCPENGKYDYVPVFENKDNFILNWENLDYGSESRVSQFYLLGLKAGKASVKIQVTILGTNIVLREDTINVTVSDNFFKSEQAAEYDLKNGNTFTLSPYMIHPDISERKDIEITADDPLTVADKKQETKTVSGEKRDYFNVVFSTDKTGTYKVNMTLKLLENGVWYEVGTLEYDITVKDSRTVDDIEFSLSKKEIGIYYDEADTIRVQADNCPTSMKYKFYYLYSKNNEAYKTGWKNKSSVVNGSSRYNDLVITGLKPGKNTLKVQLRDSETDKVLKEIAVSIDIKDYSMDDIKLSVDETDVRVKPKDEKTVRVQLNNCPYSFAADYSCKIDKEEYISAKWSEAVKETSVNYSDITFKGLKVGMTNVNIQVKEKDTENVIKEQELDVSVSDSDLGFRISDTDISIKPGEQTDLKIWMNNSSYAYNYSFKVLTDSGDEIVEAALGDWEEMYDDRLEDEDIDFTGVVSTLSIKAFKPGQDIVRIQVSESDTYKLIMEYTVNVTVSGYDMTISLDKQSLDLETYKQEAVKVKVDKCSSNVLWDVDCEIENKDIVSYEPGNWDEEGRNSRICELKFTAKAPGSTTVKVILKDIENAAVIAEASVDITVSDYRERLEISNTDVHITEGEYEDITINALNCTPNSEDDYFYDEDEDAYGAYYLNVLDSSDESVASCLSCVDGIRRIYDVVRIWGYKPGTASFKVQLTRDQVVVAEKTINVTVEEIVPRVVLGKKNIHLEKGEQESVYLSAENLPDDDLTYITVFYDDENDAIELAYDEDNIITLTSAYLIIKGTNDGVASLRVTAIRDDEVIAEDTIEVTVGDYYKFTTTVSTTAETTTTTTTTTATGSSEEETTSETTESVTTVTTTATVPTMTTTTETITTIKNTSKSTVSETTSETTSTTLTSKTKVSKTSKTTETSKTTTAKTTTAKTSKTTASTTTTSLETTQTTPVQTTKPSVTTPELIDGYYGECGENVMWAFDESKEELVIFGEGAMRDYEERFDDIHDFQEKIRHIKVEEGVTAIGAHSFEGLNYVETVELPSTLTTINEYAFRLLPADEIVIPDSVTEIGNNAFTISFLKRAKLSSGLTEIPRGMFDDSRCLESVEIPDGIEIIGQAAFYGCSALKSIEIPDSVTEIGSAAFNGCEELTNVTVPKNVTKIGSGAFSSCAVLGSITIENSDCVIEEDEYDITLSNENTIILGYVDSTAYSYAEEHHNRFVSLEDGTIYEFGYESGDANRDGKVNVRDAAFIAKMLAQGRVYELPINADFNGDGNVNVRDAAMIARHLAVGNK